MRKTTTRAATALLAVVVVTSALVQARGASGDVAAPDDARIEAVFTEGLSRGSGGIYGYFLKPVGGAPIYGRNESLAYQPASELKALPHLFGMRAVQAGTESLTSPVNVYRYPSLGANADSPGACAVLADEVPANAEVFPLEEVHRRMMRISDNRATRALEIHYGADGLKALITTLGLTATRFEEWPGCGVPGPPRLTSLADLAKLYESVSSLSSIDAEGRTNFYRLMNAFSYRDPTSTLVNDVVRPEAEALGIRPGRKFSKFINALVTRRKGGGAGGCLEHTCTRIRIIATDAGIASIPFKVGRKIQLRDYVFGTLIKDHDITCTQDPCEGDDAAHRAAYDRAMNEMLRPVIREALTTWVGKKKRR